jgi:hypothetical protein
VGPYNANIPLSISGNVKSDGSVSGTFNGSSTVRGITVNVNGTYTGKISNGKMSVSYKATAMGATVNGSITLTKK